MLVDESGVVIDIRVGEEAMSPSRNLQVSFKPGIVEQHSWSIVGGILHHIVNEGGVWWEMTLTRR